MKLYFNLGNLYTHIFLFIVKDDDYTFEHFLRWEEFEATQMYLHFCGYLGKEDSYETKIKRL